MFNESDSPEHVIFKMTITRGGKKICRSDGKPWKIVLRNTGKTER
jgi:hypothetical protein